jgi:hypothetical protein
MAMNQRILIAIVALAALAIPTAAVAKPDHGKHQGKHAEKSHGKKTKKVMFVFKGTYSGGVVDVAAGNAHVRKGGFVGQSVTFDFTDAKVRAADPNGDQQVDVTDVKDGDKVLVQARVAKRTQYADVAGAIPARKLVDKTNPRVEDDAAETP